MHQLVALLPMKAHSDRIPDKNFKDFAGKPLFRWILDTLLSIDEIEYVVINTDARERLIDSGLPDSNRLLIRERKPELIGDFVSMNKILADDIAEVPSENFLMTHNTNPLLRVDTIRKSLQAWKRSTNDSLFTVTRFQTRFYREDGSAINHDPDNLIRTQDLEPWYEENSCLYCFTADSFKKTGARIGLSPMIYEISKTEAIDIDEPEDWDIAEAVAEYKLAKGTDL